MTNRITHMVVFCLKVEKGSIGAEKFLNDGRKILSKIPKVEKFEVLSQISLKNDFQYGFSMEFEDKVAYNSYNSHPAHIEFVSKRWNLEVEKFLEIDFQKM